MKKFQAGLALVFAGGLAACVSPDASGGFEFEDGVDDTVSADEGKADSSSSSTCKAVTAPVRALGGTIITPNGPMNGYVVIQNDKIVSVVQARAQVPAGATIVDTGGVISPGLIDLHNHVAYDFLPLWNSGKRWQNRYQWARAAAYQPAVKTPYNAVKNASNMCEAVKYGEFRALVGGTTTVQGSADLACTRAWVRNVEFSNFCQDKVRTDVLAISSISQTDAATLNAQFASGATKSFIVHLAEGIDDSSRAEFEQLRALGLLKPQVVGIHSTALTPAQLEEMGQIGMKIVWSPLSNLILYGKTTDIPTALKAGIKVSIGPDWSPSGSANLLGELKVADRVNKTLFGGVITDQQLWQMATENPAAAAGLDDKIGKIAPGYYADLLVVRGDVAHPYRAIINAQPSDVLLTAISGQALFGQTSFLDAMGQAGQYTTVDACGTPRGLRVTAAITGGTEQLADLTGTFAKDGVTNVIPLFQCGAAPEWAFANISR
ncbi:MAG TPA: amidohydrolase family protein [Polyangia bacterium]|nr:amidohydrolase family protein [Polyangia bacterium]